MITGGADWQPMKYYVFDPKQKQTARRVPHIVFAGLAALIGASDVADATMLGNEPPDDYVFADCPRENDA